MTIFSRAIYVLISIFAATTDLTPAAYAETASVGHSTTQVAAHSETADPRARDAVDFFFEACVGDYITSLRKPLRMDRFDVQALDPDLSARLSKGPVRSAHAIASGAMMLISLEPEGLCMVRLAQADEPSVVAAFESSISELTAQLAVYSEPLPGAVNEVSGMKVTSRGWRIEAEGHVYRLTVTTSPQDQGYVSQHVLTIAMTR